MEIFPKKALWDSQHEMRETEIGIAAPSTLPLVIGNGEK